MPANLHFPNNTPAFLSHLHNVHSHLAIFHSPQTPHDYPLYTRKNNCVIVLQMIMYADLPST